MGRRRAGVAGVGAVVLVLVGATVALGGGPSGDEAREGGRPALKAADPSPPAATPARHTGPQGRVGQLVVACTYSHSGSHDPIVHPGHEGRSHRHDFFGAVTTGSHSTIEDLLASETTCDKAPDTAAYWQPTLYDHDEPVVPREVQAYYRAAPGIDPTTVQTMPTGLALIAGDQTATTPQPGEATGWTCGANTTLADDPPSCPRGAPLHLVLTFPDCWDGEYLDSVDHTSHVAYSADGACPASHPVPIPQLTTSTSFPVWGDDHDLRLSSGNIYSAHGDFWNAWDAEGLAREVEACIHRDVVCDLASNRGEEPLFTG